jgi:hypothetical protein
MGCETRKSLKARNYDKIKKSGKPIQVLVDTTNC